MALNRAKVNGEGGDKKDRGLTGKQFFRQLEANNEQVKYICSFFSCVEMAWRACIMHRSGAMWGIPTISTLELI